MATTKTPKTPETPTYTVEQAQLAGIVKAEPYARYIGIVTVKGESSPCQHLVKNGHMTEDAALKCARRLARSMSVKNVDEAAGTTVKHRYMGAVKVSESESVPCDCQIGHRAEESAIECATRKARALGIVVKTQKPASETKSEPEPKPEAEPKPEPKPAAPKTQPRPRSRRLRAVTEGAGKRA